MVIAFGQGCFLVSVLRFAIGPVLLLLCIGPFLICSLMCVSLFSLCDYLH